MSKPFDASPKALLQYGPADWAAFAGVKARSVELVNADVSTVTAATDKVLRVHTAAGDRIQHFEFQSGPDKSVPRRTHCYNGLLENRHAIPVESIVVLLARKANLRTITGIYKRTLPDELKPYLHFRYRVVRVWRLPVDEVLKAGPSVLPLAPISNVRANRLPEIIERMENRFSALSDPTRVAELWTATKVLKGLCYDAGFTEQLLQGVRAMKESVTYQAIVREGEQKGFRRGKAREARRILLKIGADRFGIQPNPEQQRQLEAITDVGRLEDLAVRVSHVRNWSELLATPATPSRRRKKS